MQRVDPSTGCVELAEFIDVGQDLVYTVHHLPPSSRAGHSLVMCSPFFAEFPRNYRREVLVARRLAERGVAVTRFHHRGVGNSTGDAALMGLDRLIEDARRVAAVAAETSGAHSLAFHGTRLAGFTAAAAAIGAQMPVSLWEPVVRGSKYFNEVLRTRMVQAVHDGETDVSAGSLRHELTSGAPVDVLGHSLHPELYTSLHDQTLDELLGPPAREILVVEFGRKRKDVGRMIERALEQGLTATLAVSTESESWWVANRRADYFVAEERRQLTGEVVRTMDAWFEKLGWTA
ncbi:MAG: hypothetical protein OEM97_05275 [Acidimicrobiia bacterium]|nr:hypothetical protein [Acidimicrobiia bacterium]